MSSRPKIQAVPVAPVPLSSNGRPIPLPERARILLEALNADLLNAQHAFNAGMAGVRSALGVPDEYILLSTAEGFGPDPRKQDEQS